MSRVMEGDVAPCVYCANGQVQIDEVTERDPRDDPSVFAEIGCSGTCDSCGEWVEYDYDPIESPPVPGSRTCADL